MIKDTIKDFLKFLLRPSDHRIPLNFRDRVQIISILFASQILITITILVPILLLIDKSIDLTKRININDFSPWEIFILLVILIPFIEELIFRYFLRYERLKLWRIDIHRWNKIFPTLVYIFVLCFGLLHLSNFSNSSKWFYILSPLIVMSQIFTGFVITFIRVRLNFISGVFYHWIWNFAFIFAIPELETLLSGTK